MLGNEKNETKKIWKLLGLIHLETLAFNALYVACISSRTCCQCENLVWQLATAVTPDPQYLIGKSHAPVLHRSVCRMSSSRKPDTEDISPGRTGRIHPVSSFPLSTIYFYKVDYLSYCFYGCASWTCIVHMWLPGRGPSACHRLAWASRKQAQTVQMCTEGCRWLGGGGIWVPTWHES